MQNITKNITIYEQTTELEIERFAAQYPFELDRFQKEAIQQLVDGSSVLVAAPTGTGKTLVAEFAIWQALQHKQRVMYTTPLKALSNQKYQDFCRLYGSDCVGLMTGDIVENRSAPIIIMTTEVYRNMLLEEDRYQYENPEVGRASMLNDVAFLIFDELHYLSDPQRGPVWEEAIICSPPHIQLVCLSATVSNASELIDWISRVHRPISLVAHEQRAVPLEHYYMLDGKLHLVQDAQGRRVERFPKVGGEAKRLPGRRHMPFSHRWKNNDQNTSLRQNEDMQERKLARQERDTHSTHHQQVQQAEQPRRPRVAPTTGEVLIALQENDLLPCLYFLPGRKLVEETALQVAEQCFTTPEEQQMIASQIAHWQKNLPLVDRQLPQVQALAQLLPRGIGFHHAGLLPGLKLLVENLFVQGYLRAVFATDTLALGVNMPARTVVVGSLSKFDGQQMRLLTPNEYRQLTGRAGRRGLDIRGAAVIPYSPWEPFEEAFSHIVGPQLPVTSSFAIRYNSVLNLWHPDDQEHLQYIYASSLGEYQRALRHQQRKIKRVEQREHARSRKGRTRSAWNARENRSYDLDYPNLSAVGNAELEGIIRILQDLDFINTDDQLTVKGQLLRQIFHPAGIILVELMTRGVLADCSPLELAEICSWLAFERDRRLSNHFELNAKLKNIREELWEVAEEVQALEGQAGLSLSPTIMPDFHSIALSWAKGKPLSDIVQHVDLAEGDLLMLLNQTIDLLQQVQAAVGSVLDNRNLWGNTELSLRQKHTHQRRKAAKQREAVQRNLSQLRSKLAQASACLLHGLILQSRRLPSMIVPIDATPLDEQQEDELVGRQREKHAALPDENVLAGNILLNNASLTALA